MLFKFCNSIISLEMLEFLMNGGIIFLQLYYVFLGNYVGQNIIDCSISICQATQVLNIFLKFFNNVNTFTIQF